MVWPILAADRNRFAGKTEVTIARTRVNPIWDPDDVPVYGFIDGLLDCIVVGRLGDIVDRKTEFVSPDVHSGIEDPRIPVDVRLFRIIALGISGIDTGRRTEKVKSILIQEGIPIHIARIPSQRGSCFHPYCILTTFDI